MLNAGSAAAAAIGLHRADPLIVTGFAVAQNVVAIGLSKVGLLLEQFLLV